MDNMGEDNIMVKKFFLCLFLTISLVACAPQNKIFVQESEDTYTAKEYCENVLRCLEEKDEQGLKNMFCEKITLNSSTLDDEIEKAMTFFDGNIESYQNPLYPSNKSIREGICTEYSVSPSIHKIQTDLGKEYDIKFYCNIIDTEHSDRVGISEIVISCNGTKEVKVGDFYIVNPEYR